MATQKSTLQRCLTPKVELPATLTLTASIACWVLVFGLWAALSYGGVVPTMFLPTPGAVLDAAMRLSTDGTLGKHVLASVEAGQARTGQRRGRGHRFCCFIIGCRPIGIADGQLSHRPGIA